MSDQHEQQGHGDAGQDEPVGGYGDSTEAEALTGETSPDDATAPADDADAAPAEDPDAD